jgi:hypothetical protein
LTRLWQQLMAQAGSPANPLKKNLVSRCVNQVGLDRATQYSRDGSDNREAAAYWVTGS